LVGLVNAVEVENMVEDWREEQSSPPAEVENVGFLTRLI
jgi:hypothetical protein